MDRSRVGLVILAALVAAATNAPAARAGSRSYDTPGAYLYRVPDSVTTLTVSAVGANGSASASPCLVSSGGKGRIVTQVLAVTPGELLQINVGGPGFRPGTFAPGGGGFNGGGNSFTCTSGGGGASDVRRSPYGAGDRVVVAGGGGGAGSGGAGGDAGSDGFNSGGSTPGNGGDAGVGGVGGAGGAAPDACCSGGTNGNATNGGNAGTGNSSGGGGGGGNGGGGGGSGGLNTGGNGGGGGAGGGSLGTPTGFNLSPSGTGSVTLTHNATTMEVIKIISPAADPGRFDLRINGTTVLADAASGDSSGQHPVSAGPATTTVEEAAGTGTNLSHFTSAIACDNGASGIGPGPLSLTVAAAGSVICTITNTRNTGSAGDRLWLDADADGVQDAGEAGINGVTIELLDSAGVSVLATTTTAGDGAYSFTSVAAATHRVRVIAATLPAGLAATFDLDGVGTPHVASFALAAGENRTDVDFGYRNTAAAGDRLWLDSDGDGTQDAGEAGIGGVTVELLDSGGSSVLATTTTAGDGGYGFSGLASAAYRVRIVAATLPAGLVATFDLDGVVSPHLAAFALAAGEIRTDVDFGYARQTDLAIANSDGLVSAAPGQVVTYAVTVTNAGPSAAAGAAVSMTLPGSLSGASWTCSGQGGASCSVASGTGDLAVSAAGLPSGGGLLIEVTATVAASFVGVLSTTAQVVPPPDVIDSAAGNDAATDVTTVTSPALLSGTKTVAGDFRRGGTVFYTVVVANQGPSVQLDNPGDELHDELPATLSLVSAQATTGVATIAGNSVLWNGSLPAGQSVTITIEAVIASDLAGATPISNQATLAYDADGDGVNEATAVTDDPATGGAPDATTFVVPVGIAEIPALSAPAMALSVLLLAAFGVVRLSRARHPRPPAP